MKLSTVLFAFFVAIAPSIRADPIAGEVGEQARTPGSKIGISLGLGGGVSNFTSSDMKSAVDVGGNYEVRATIGTRLFFAAEAAYVGSRRNVTLSGVTGTAGETPHVFSNGAEGVVRAQYPYLTGNWVIEPFAFGGVGYTHYGVDGAVPQGSRLATADDVMTVPFGGGISATWSGLVLEGRFTYRATFYNDLLTKPDGTRVPLDNWSAAALIGYEF